MLCAIGKEPTDHEGLVPLDGLMSPFERVRERNEERFDERYLGASTRVGCDQLWKLLGRNLSVMKLAMSVSNGSSTEIRHHRLDEQTWAGDPESKGQSLGRAGDGPQEGLQVSGGHG